MSSRLESDDGAIFETSGPVMFSLMEKKMGLTFQWKAWKMRVLTINMNSTAQFRKDKNDTTILGSFLLTKVNVEQLDHRAQAEGEKEQGIVVNCQTADGYDTSFRCILNEKEVASIKDAIRMVAKEHNVDDEVRCSITEQVQKVAAKSPQSMFGNKSVMRRAIARAMDNQDKRSAKDKIIAKRGAMKYLPVIMANDLVHGSWWFVLGSVLFVLTSALILANSYRHELGEDDSVLSPNYYRWSWILMIICGVFCTLGSMSFMRAVHDEPPMKPLFPDWYHLQSDELLGSWLLLCSGIPIVPYALLYLSTEHHNMEYLGALAIAGVLVAGCSLFVYCCYPSDKPRRKLIQPIAYAMCCCFLSRDWMRFHFNNDWLAATWLMYWGTWFANVVCFALFLKSIAENNPLRFFIYGTGLLESLMFLVGAAYFVAGSYPDGLTAADLDSSHSVHHPSISTMRNTGESAGSALDLEGGTLGPMHENDNL